MGWHDWLGVLGSIASFAGLVITILVFVNVRKLRTRYVRQALLSECVSKLKAHRRNLQSGITKKNFASIRRSLRRIKAVHSRIELHRGAGSEIELSAVRFEDLLEVGDMNLLDKVDGVVPVIDEWLEQIELELSEIAWGKEDE